MGYPGWLNDIFIPSTGSCSATTKSYCDSDGTSHDTSTIATIRTARKKCSRKSMQELCWRYSLILVCVCVHFPGKLLLHWTGYWGSGHIRHAVKCKSSIYLVHNILTSSIHCMYKGQGIGKDVLKEAWNKQINKQKRPDSEVRSLCKEWRLEFTFSCFWSCTTT